MATGARREFLISKAWIQAAILVMLFGFFVLGLLAYRTYRRSRRSRGGSSMRAATVLFTGADISARPAGVPAQRADGVRLGVRARRLSRARLHGRLPAPLLRHGARRLRRRRLRRGGPADDRGPARQPLRRGRGHADLQRAAGGRLPQARAATTATSSPTRRPSTGCGRTRSPTETRAAAAHSLLRLDGLGGGGEPARATTTATRTTGRPSRGSTTSRPRT